MDFGCFQALLNAGMRWRMREQQMAMSAATFPQMEEKEKRRMVSELDAALKPPEPEEQTEKRPPADPGANNLRAYTRLQQRIHPLTAEQRKLLQVPLRLPEDQRKSD